MRSSAALPTACSIHGGVMFACDHMWCGRNIVKCAQPGERHLVTVSTPRHSHMNMWRVGFFEREPHVHRLAVKSHSPAQRETSRVHSWQSRPLHVGRGSLHSCGVSVSHSSPE